MSDYRIPFNRPGLIGTELDYIREAVERGHLAADGEFTRRCSELLEQEIGVERALLTPSCTHALEMCALLLDLAPGDEVIVPSFAFVTTANAFVLHGARPVFVDIRSDTLNLDERQLEQHVTDRTRAIVALHYAGVACEMDPIGAIAREHGIAVVEDNAHGLFGRYAGRPLGSLGDFATQSFHETKNFTCGEGGALLLNRAESIERAEILRQKGTDRARFLRGDVGRYTWVDLGSSFVPSEMQAAFLWAQLEQRGQIQTRRSQLWHRYGAELRDWADQGGVGLPNPPAQCEHPSHTFYLLMPSERARSALIEHLRERGILAVFHFQPLHRSRMAEELGASGVHCPVTDDVSERLLRLPLYNAMTDAEQDEVIASVRDFRGP